MIKQKLYWIAECDSCNRKYSDEDWDTETAIPFEVREELELSILATENWHYDNETGEVLCDECQDKREESGDL